MANFFRPRHRPAGRPPNHEGRSPEGGKSPPLSSSAGLSVALSVLFYVLVLAADMKFDRGPHNNRNAAGAVQVSNRIALDGSALPVVSPEASAQSGDSAQVLIARAHDCAAVGQWDCVFDATTSAIALRGETPETRALLEQAMQAGAWKAPRALAATRPLGVHKASLEANASTKGTRETTHAYKHARRDKKVRYASVAHPASFADMATLYHQ
jgi:hypothetical protein